MKKNIENIENEIIDKEAKIFVRNYKSNLDILKRNYNIGENLSLAINDYGEKIIYEYASVLTKEFGDSYNYEELYKMKLFYELIQMGVSLVPNLTWNHYKLLLELKDTNEINYYIDITIKENLSKSKLEEKIKNDEYHKL